MSPLARTLPPNELVSAADSVLALGVSCRRVPSGPHHLWWVGRVGKVRVEVKLVPQRVWVVEAHVEDARDVDSGDPSERIALGSSVESFALAEAEAEESFARLQSGVSTLRAVWAACAVAALPGARL